MSYHVNVYWGFHKMGTLCFRSP